VHAKIYYNSREGEPMAINRLCKTRGLGEEEKRKHVKKWSM
jgi:hypothetical protein